MLRSYLKKSSFPEDHAPMSFTGDWPKDMRVRHFLTVQGLRNAFAKRIKAYFKDPTPQREKRVNMALLYQFVDPNPYRPRYDYRFRLLFLKSYLRRSRQGDYLTPERLHAFVNSLQHSGF